MKITCTKGTPSQLLDAVKRQIDFLEGSNDITSAQTVEASQDTLFHQLYDCWGDEQDYDAFKEDVIDTYNNDVAQGAFEGSLDEYLKSELANSKDAGYVRSDTYYDPGTVESLDDMTIGEMIRFLYAYWQSETIDPDAVDYYGYEEHLGQCYQSEYEDDFTGSYDEYLRERCEDAIADGFELTDEFLGGVNDSRQEVAEFNASPILDDEPIESSISYDDVNIDDAEFQEALDYLASKGYDTSDWRVKNEAKAIAEYLDISRRSYAQLGETSTYTMDDWYRDTQMNYPEYLDDLPRVDSDDDDIESSTGTTNIACNMELNQEQVDRLWAIADSFVSTEPLSRNWASETGAEQRTIAKEFGCSLDEAKGLMINYLGFAPDDAGFIESCTDVTAADEFDASIPEKDSNFITYETVEAAESADEAIEDADIEIEDVEDNAVDAEDDDDVDSNLYLSEDEYNHLNLVSDKLNEWVSNGAEVGPNNYTIDSILLDDNDADNIYITLTYQKDDIPTVVEYELPVEDLGFSDVDEDFNYIIDELQDSFYEED